MVSFWRFSRGGPYLYFLYICKNKERWYLQSRTRIEEPKGKNEGNAKKSSLSTNLKPLLFSTWLWYKPTALLWMWLSNLEGRRLVALIVKNDSITSCPDSPASHDNNFSQDETAKGCSRFYHHVQRLKTQITMDWQGVPTRVAKRTFKKQMEANFLTNTIT